MEREATEKPRIIVTIYYGIINKTGIKWPFLSLTRRLFVYLPSLVGSHTGQLLPPPHTLVARSVLVTQAPRDQGCQVSQRLFFLRLLVG